MNEIKIRGVGADGWRTVKVLPNDERQGWVQVEVDDEPQWVEFADVHPADQVALRVESIARQRYEWVPDKPFGRNAAEG